MLIHIGQFSVYSVQCRSIQGVSVPLNAVSSGHPSSGGGLVQLADLGLDSSHSHPTMASFNSIPFGEILFENQVVGSVQLADSSSLDLE